MGQKMDYGATIPDICAENVDQLTNCGMFADMITLQTKAVYHVF